MLSVEDVGTVDGFVLLFLSTRPLDVASWFSLVSIDDIIDRVSVARRAACRLVFILVFVVEEEGDCGNG